MIFERNWKYVQPLNQLFSTFHLKSSDEHADSTTYIRLFWQMVCTAMNHLACPWICFYFGVWVWQGKGVIPWLGASLYERVVYSLHWSIERAEWLWEKINDLQLKGWHFKPWAFVYVGWIWMGTSVSHLIFLIGQKCKAPQCLCLTNIICKYFANKFKKMAWHLGFITIPVILLKEASPAHPV